MEAVEYLLPNIKKDMEGLFDQVRKHKLKEIGRQLVGDFEIKA